MRAVAAPLFVVLAVGCGVVLALRPWEAAPELPAVEIAPAEAPPAARRLPVAEEATPAPAAAPDRPENGDTAWILRNNAAIEALEAGRLQEAVDELRLCRRALPDHEAFRANLAEALIRLARERHEERRLEEALENLEEALVEGHDRPDHPVLLQLRDRWRTEAEVEENHWSEASDLFELSYDTDRRDILHNSTEVLTHLEDRYEVLRLWFGADPVRERGRAPIRVVLYNHAEFDALTGLGDWAGGVFDGTVRVSVEDLEAGAGRWRGLLTHELVHVFVQEFGGRAVPGWLNEGLAQVFEGPPGRIAQARERLRTDRIFPLEKLAGSLASWSDPAAIGRAYAQSLVFVDELRSSHGDEGLRRMVVGCAESGGPEAAFRDWAGMDLEDYFQDWTTRLPR